MLNKPLEEINQTDLQQSIDNRVMEGKSIEYKLDLPGKSESDRKEFLADVSSFANTSGGDLIYGVTEKDGVPIGLVGVTIQNIDEEKRRYDSIIQDGIEPRIQVTIHPVKVSQTNIVLILRIKRSWIGPHRVIFKGHDKFYARNSAGKYPLDTMQLRTAFNLSETQSKRIRDFKTERISKLISDDTPVPFVREGGKIVLHVMPLEAFDLDAAIDIKLGIAQKQGLQPVNSGMIGGTTFRINLEGLLIYFGTSGKTTSYVQLYRYGIIEAVEGFWLRADRSDRFLPSLEYEKQLPPAVSNYIKALKELSIRPPFLVFLTFIGVKGWEMLRGSILEFDSGYPIDRDVLSLPESWSRHTTRICNDF